MNVVGWGTPVPPYPVYPGISDEYKKNNDKMASRYRLDVPIKIWRKNYYEKSTFNKAYNG